MKYHRTELLPGVRLTAIQTSKFKSGYWGVYFLAPMGPEAAANALVSRVLRRGTRRHPGVRHLSEALDELYGGAIEAAVRKKGEVQCTGFAASFLDDALAPGGEDLIAAAAGLLGELLLDPALENGVFRSDWLEGERTNLVDQIRGEINDKRFYAQRRAIELMCKGEGYGLDAKGTIEGAESVTPESLYRRYQALLSSAPVELYYCGSAEAERAAEAWTAVLSRLPQGSRSQALPDQSHSPSQEAFRQSDRLDVTQGKLVLGFSGGGAALTHPDYPAFLTLNALYGGTTTSKLFLNVREKRSLCYYASSMVDKLKGLMLVSSGVEFEQFQAAEDEILAQLEACRQGNFTEEELSAAKKSLISGLRSTLDVQWQLEDFWLTQNVGGTEEGPEALAARIERVTARDVAEQAGRTRLELIYRMEGKEYGAT